MGEQRHVTGDQTHIPGQVIDGLVRKPHMAKKTQHLPHQPPSAHQRQTVAAHHIHHRTDHTHTLMRTAVKKPLHAKASKPSVLVGKHTARQVLEPVMSHQSQINAHRATRASSVTKSNLVSRFVVPGAYSSMVKKTAHLAVQTAPNQPIGHHASMALAGPIAPRSASQDFFAKAITHATSHEATLHKRSKHRQKAKKLGMGRQTFNVSAAMLIAVILGGFIAYQNMANISMRVATAKAGLAASLPGYKPAGFSLSRDIQAGPGRITVSFRSNSDSRSFNITQQTSNWNSETLLHSFVATTRQSYQRVTTANGQTVYLYGDTNATWVDSGIWYQVQGKSSLSSEQLLKMAASF